ncbi:hypothetical protein [Dyella mobilis]|uniref:Uncharacterized protein n=1 Tax=Dyella mobilis TaxID=1849582 RepID=A0ABS2KMM6_9GAMM|nr:hypothetical protein [Dyella mobilis]MBM7131678.1 hypothetical protein [Dyella mobilis]GLQ96347.1 hypothetical protein GCM10007863_07650 [Dyella mobilis]
MSESQASAQPFDGEQATDSTAVSDREVGALLSDLPSAHGASPTQPGVEPASLGYRLRAWRRRLNDPAKRARRAARITRHIRFVYFAHVDDDSLFGEYHHELVTAEVLLDRVLAAHASGMKAVHPFLSGDAEERLFTRPQRGSFHHVTPEYIRWYGRDGMRRSLPMVREELAIELMYEYAYCYADALDVATRNSGALARTDQAWLLARAKAPITCRPLHATELQQLVKAIEAAHDVPHGDATVSKANREIARRAAAMLGAVLDEYVETPFATPELAQAFADFHSAHLRRVATATRLNGLLPMPVTGVLGWFSAKRARIYAEVQARLAAR